ncbi:uncharacterized protein EV422DRAFT_79357 [Fimicolochytrium jonesii]|uniref:uncharacterized protein n=1 Tax=Fimicolochytrium jonesii TaxID=1396493 RepID=UPI0022FF1C38|nr:uncharacterized protein EV422DRAFT_79357 [Fimicolochytrium jonesii]KAI8820116.1 hypothetical protein EV422DRAFT_79357 [Fimicolochytrium jonesii]
MPTPANSAQQESDDNDDYMSDALLLGTATAPPTTGRGREPDAITYSERRKEALRRQQEKGIVKSVKEQERETREQGLASELTQENKGFQMLAKMGYRKGMAIGNSSSAVEEQKPIEVVLKSDKSGLGIRPPSPPINKRQRRPSEERALELAQSQSRLEYRQAQNARFLERQILSDLRKARKACEALDVKLGVERNDFWMPERKDVKHAAEIEDAGDPRAETALTRLVRESVEAEHEGATVLDDGEEEESEFERLPPSVQLEAVNTYLRDLHHYCVWCAAAYDSAKELNELCPGPTADDHD